MEDFDLVIDREKKEFKRLPGNYSGIYVMDDYITSIADNAFDGCSGLTSLEIPSGVTSIGDSAFRGCSGLTSLEIPSGVTSIGHGAFYGCSGLTSLEIPSGVTSIGDSAFRGCSGLTSLEIPSGVTSIGDEAFEGCSGLISLEIPSGVTSIGYEAFSGCTGLSILAIPDSVDRIGGGCFLKCSSLKRIRILRDRITIDWPVFTYCPELRSITIGDKHPDYVIADGIIYNRNRSKLLECVPSMCPEEITIDAKVVSIGGEAFRNLKSIKSITLPKGLKRIEKSAFDFDGTELKVMIQTANPEDISIESGDSPSLCSVSEKQTLIVPIGSGYAYRHHPQWGRFKVIIAQELDDIPDGSVAIRSNE